MDRIGDWTGRARALGAAAALLVVLVTMVGLGAGGASASTGDSVVVAAGFDGKLYTSTNDGVTWGSAVSPLSGTQYLYDVAKGYNGFVAGFSGSPSCGKVATSPDGTTWTVQTTNQSWCFADIQYRDGLFVAAGYGFIGTSTDGVTWTPRESIGGWGNDVAYGNGVWVVGTSSAAGYRSTDGGVTWTGTTIGFATLGVEYAGDRFFALGTGGNLKWSTDGTTWTAPTSPTSTYDLRFAKRTTGGLYLVGGSGGIWTSPDLSTWTQRSTASVRAVTVASNGTFVAGGYAGVMTSSDAITWTNRMPTQSGDLTALAGGVAAPPPTTTTTTTSTSTTTTVPPTTTTTDPMDGPCRWEWGGMQEFHPEPCPGSDSIELTRASAPDERPIGGADLLALGLVLLTGRAVLRAADRRRS